VVAALFPDIDSLAGLFFPTEFIIRYHRSLTNSLLFVVPMAWILARVFAGISRLPRFRTFFFIALVEILVHDFLDLINSYGTLLFYPFSWDRLSLDWVFIVDPYFTAIFVLGALLTPIWRGKARLVARGTLVLALAYVGLCAMNHERALSLARDLAEREGLSPMVTAALPQPLSPFFWGLYLKTPQGTYEALVDLSGRTALKTSPEAGFLEKLRARYLPPSGLRYHFWPEAPKTPCRRKAEALDGVRTYLWFARFPIIREEPTPEGGCRIRFFDLRFSALGGSRPFTYTVTLDPAGRPLSWGYETRFGFSRRR